MHREVMQRFITQELIEWKQFQQMFGVTLREGSREEPCTGVFRENPKYWEELGKRVVEHVSCCAESEGCSGLHPILCFLCSEYPYCCQVLHKDPITSFIRTLRSAT